ncbi:MAG: hypothetical protein ACJAZX_000333 [Rickettsiales bacterium]|jgi:hypothetical protein
MSDNSFFSAIERQLKNNQEELVAAEEITKVVYPHIKDLKRREIVNPVILRISLHKLPTKYRDPVFGLCRIAVDGGPEGSYIILDSGKVSYMIDNIEIDTIDDAQIGTIIEAFDNIDIDSDEGKSILDRLSEDKRKRLITILHARKNKKKPKKPKLKKDGNYELDLIEEENLENVLNDLIEMLENMDLNSPEGKDFLSSLPEDKRKKLIAALNEKQNRKKGKLITGITHQIIDSIRSLVVAELSVLCNLVNGLVNEKIIKTPSPEALYHKEAQSLVKTQDKSR